jgi:hypothetical protein
VHRDVTDSAGVDFERSPTTVDSDVTSTLSELERRLKELEQELESVGRGGELDTEPVQGGWDAPRPAPARDPGPPPPGATPFAAAWHGSGGPAPAPRPPVSPFDGAPPVPVVPPAAPWGAAAAAPVPPPRPAAPPAPAPADRGLHHQLDELLAFRDQLVRTTDDLVAELSRVLTELGVDAPHDPADTLLSGHVVIEAAPFADFATLAAFEQALARTPGVVAVDVRALDSGRATIDVSLAGPVPLGSALRATAPVAFAVTAADEGRLTIALAPPAS